MPGVTFLIFSIEALSSFVRFKMSATEPWFNKRRNNVLNMLSSETLHLAVKNLIGFHSCSLSLLLFEALLWKWTCPVSHLHQALNPFFTFFTMSRTQPHTHATEITLLSVFTIPSTICKITLCIPLCPEQALLFISDNYLKKNIIFLLFTIVSCKKLPFLLTISVLG